MPLIKIDGQELEVEAGSRLLDVALEAGIEVPHYCYHPALSVVGSCRLCMVEVEGMPKLQTACSTPIGEAPPDRKVDGKYDMVVHTDTDKVVAGQKLVLEFLLLNHPLDCPVCDQAGECGLQDYSFKFGNAHSRFDEDKRVRAAEELGSGVVINQNRCIMCTRCVRFTQEITGTNELYVHGRGYDTKIAIFDGLPLDNPLSGNVADICPVGALLLKDYMHTTRVWHLSHTESACVECSSGCSITVDATDNVVRRIVSRRNDQANGHFICDFGRYSFHKYERSEFKEPMRKTPGSGWEMIPWRQAYQLIEDKVAAGGGPGAVKALASPTLPNEPNYILGQFMGRLSDRKNIALLPVTQLSDMEFPGGFRISGDKGGNSRGARDVIPALAASVKSLHKTDTGVIIILDGDGRAEIKGDLTRLMAAAQFSVVLASIPSEVTQNADLVLPIASPYAREGTFTNDQGLVQWLQPALHPPDDVRADWQVVAELGQQLTGEDHLYSYAGDVTWKITQTTVGYGQITRFRLGKLGQFTARAAG